MKLTITPLLLFFLCLTIDAFSQYPNSGEATSSISYGIKAGAARSCTENLDQVILSEPYFINFLLTPKFKWGGTAGGYFNYRRSEILGVLFEIMYSQQGSDLEFQNFEKDFNYRMEFDYQFLNINLFLKCYPLGKKENSVLSNFSIAAGPQLGFNLAPNNIKYESWGTGRLDVFGSDLDQQQQLRNVLKGKNNLAINIIAGYEFNFGLTLDARYSIGISDIVETQANSYNFIEAQNRNSYIQILLGFDFSKFGSSE